MVLALSQINEVRINDCVILDELVDETAVGAYSAWSRGYGGGIGDGAVSWIKLVSLCTGGKNPH